MALRALIYSGAVKSAHDCSEGGLAVALAESCISQQIARETPRLIGAQIDLTTLAVIPGDSPTLRLDALLFGEAQGRVIITVAALNAGKVLAQAKILGITASRIGTVGGGAFQIKTPGTTLSCDLLELHDLWWNSIARAMRNGKQILVDGYTQSIIAASSAFTGIPTPPN